MKRAPEQPEQIVAWLEYGWDDPWNALTIKETSAEAQEGVEPRTVKFTDDPGRIASLERWHFQRSEWVKTEKPARAAMRIFETLYALYGPIDREGERVELVLGDGVLLLSPNLRFQKRTIPWSSTRGQRHLSSDPSAAPAVTV